MKWLEKLNTPKAVVVVLAICLPVDGFLLYEYRAAVEEASRPEAAAAEAAPPPATTTEAAELEPTTAEAAAYPVAAPTTSYREQPIRGAQYGADGSVGP